MLRGLARKVISVGHRQMPNYGVYQKSAFTLRRFFSDQPAKIHPDVQERIMELSRRFLEKVKDAHIDKLTPTSTFEELGMDSLDSVDFIVALEESFGFDVSNEDAENKIRSIKDACEVFTEYIDKKAQETSGTNTA